MKTADKTPLTRVLSQAAQRKISKILTAFLLKSFKVFKLKTYKD